MIYCILIDGVELTRHNFNLKLFSLCLCIRTPEDSYPYFKGKDHFIFYRAKTLTDLCDNYMGYKIN